MKFQGFAAAANCFRRNSLIDGSGSAFPVNVKPQQVDAAVKAAVQAAEQRFEQTFALARKDVEAEKRFAEMQAKNPQETITRQSAEIETLHRQLEEANK